MKPEYPQITGPIGSTCQDRLLNRMSTTSNYVRFIETAVDSKSQIELLNLDFIHWNSVHSLNE